MKPDLDKAWRLVKESGYDGRPVVVIQITDLVFLSYAAIVTRRRLESIGFNVELRPMDWSKNLVERNRKDPPDKGGWNLIHTWWTAADVISPAVHFGLSPGGSGAWYGWHNIPQFEKRIVAWLRETDQSKRTRIADDIQRVAFDEVPYVPWGEWDNPTAFRQNVQGVLKFTAPFSGT